MVLSMLLALTTTGLVALGTPATATPASQAFSGSQLASSWLEGNYAGADCSPGSNGTYRVSGNKLELSSKGNDSCAEIRSPEEFTTGKFTARIYVNRQWGAFWLSGVNWPDNGELDAMEVLGGRPSTTYHDPSGADGPYYMGASDPGWHVVKVVRTSTTDTVYWDGVKVHTYTKATADAPETVYFDETDGGNLWISRMYIKATP